MPAPPGTRSSWARAPGASGCRPGERQQRRHRNGRPGVRHPGRVRCNAHVHGHHQEPSRCDRHAGRVRSQRSHRHLCRPVRLLQRTRLPDDDRRRRLDEHLRAGALPPPQHDRHGWQRDPLDDLRGDRPGRPALRRQRRQLGGPGRPPPPERARDGSGDARAERSPPRGDLRPRGLPADLPDRPRHRCERGQRAELRQRVREHLEHDAAPGVQRGHDGPGDQQRPEARRFAGVQRARQSADAARDPPGFRGGLHGPLHAELRRRSPSRRSSASAATIRPRRSSTSWPRARVPRGTS